MSLTEKYQSIVDLSNSLGVSGLNVVEGEGVLHISGSATSAEDKKRIWDEYARLDPDYRTGDLVLDINAPEAAQNTYTVQSGDSLSKIGAKYGIGYMKIFEANRDKLDDPDKIQPGQELTIPSE